MENKLKNQLKELKALDIQRKMWLVLSAIVIVVIGFIIFDKAGLEQYNILWTAGVAGLILSVVWWYWAMRLINKLVNHRVEEMEVLTDLCVTVKELKEDVRKNFTKDVD